MIDARSRRRRRRRSRRSCQAQGCSTTASARTVMCKRTLRLSCGRVLAKNWPQVRHIARRAPAATWSAHMQGHEASRPKSDHRSRVRMTIDIAHVRSDSCTVTSKTGRKREDLKLCADRDIVLLRRAHSAGVHSAMRPRMKGQLHHESSCRQLRFDCGACAADPRPCMSATNFEHITISLELRVNQCGLAQAGATHGS